MATIIGKMLRGILGPVVLRQVGKKQRVSVKPPKGKVKQTKATKKAANTFGMASTLGSHIRHSFEPYLNGLTDAAVGPRMTTQLYEALILCRDPKTRLYSFEEQSFNQLNNYDYNLGSPVNKSLTKTLITTVADGKLKVVLPVLTQPGALKFPAESSACELTIGVLLLRLGAGLKVYAPETQRLIIQKADLNTSGQEFQFKAPDGCLCIVSIFLKYYSLFNNLATISNSKKFSPAAISMAVVIPGSYQGNDGVSWIRMHGLKFNQK